MESDDSNDNGLNISIDETNDDGIISSEKQKGMYYSRHYCVVKGCKSSKANDKSISFHRFPKNEERAKLWAKACSREDLLNKKVDLLNKNYFVCGLHFEDNTFKSNGKRLNKDVAIPTIFQPPEPFQPLDPATFMIQKTYPHHRCAVKNCTVVQLATKYSITFHRFPRDEERAKKWCKGIGREDLLNRYDAQQLNRNYFVCGMHFADSMFCDFNPRRLMQEVAMPVIEHVRSMNYLKPIRKKTDQIIVYNQSTDGSCNYNSDNIANSNQNKLEDDKNKCVVKNCESTRLDPNMFFHTFPENTERAKIWAIACRREDLVRSKIIALHNIYYVCEKHFEKSMYIRDTKDLGPFSVPRIFDFNDINKRNRHSPMKTPKTKGIKKEDLADALESVVHPQIPQSSPSIQIPSPIIVPTPTTTVPQISISPPISLSGIQNNAPISTNNSIENAQQVKKEYIDGYKNIDNGYRPTVTLDQFIHSTTSSREIKSEGLPHSINSFVNLNQHQQQPQHQPAPMQFNFGNYMTNPFAQLVPQQNQIYSNPGPSNANLYMQNIE